MSGKRLESQKNTGKTKLSFGLFNSTKLSILSLFPFKKRPDHEKGVGLSKAESLSTSSRKLLRGISKSKWRRRELPTVFFQQPGWVCPWNETLNSQRMKKEGAPFCCLHPMYYSSSGCTYMWVWGKVLLLPQSKPTCCLSTAPLELESSLAWRRPARFIGMLFWYFLYLQRITLVFGNSKP